MAHTGKGVERSSLPPDVPQGMGARTKLLAGHVSGAAESVIVSRDEPYPSTTPSAARREFLRGPPDNETFIDRPRWLEPHLRP